MNPAAYRLETFQDAVIFPLLIFSRVTKRIETRLKIDRLAQQQQRTQDSESDGINLSETKSYTECIKPLTERPRIPSNHEGCSLLRLDLYLHARDALANAWLRVKDSQSSGRPLKVNNTYGPQTTPTLSAFYRLYVTYYCIKRHVVSERQALSRIFEGVVLVLKIQGMMHTYAD